MEFKSSKISKRVSVGIKGNFTCSTTTIDATIENIVKRNLSFKNASLKSFKFFLFLVIPKIFFAYDAFIIDGGNVEKAFLNAFALTSLSFPVAIGGRKYANS